MNLKKREKVIYSILIAICIFSGIWMQEAQASNTTTSGNIQQSPITLGSKSKGNTTGKQTNKSSGDIAGAIGGTIDISGDVIDGIVKEVDGESGAFNTDQWEPGSTTSVTGASKLKSIGNVIIGTIRTIGSILSVAVLLVIGIKYMIGSVEEKAEYKKTMIPYVIGAIMVFGITNLLSIIANIVSKIV